METVTAVEPVILYDMEPGTKGHKGMAVAINMKHLGHIIVVAQDTEKASEVFSKLCDGGYPDVDRMREVIVISAKEAY